MLRRSSIAPLCMRTVSEEAYGELCGALEILIRGRPLRKI